MEVTREQELPAAMAAAGLELDDVSDVVLTHTHGDHMDGLVHIRGRVMIHEKELEFLASPMARVMRRVLRQPLPPGFAPEPFALGDGPFGAFARSRSLSTDGRIVAVDTPGHTPGHISIICVDDAGRHVMLAGDTNRLARAAPRAARRRGRTRPKGAHRHDADDPRPLRRAPNDLPALTRPRLRRAIRQRDHVRGRRDPRGLTIDETDGVHAVVTVTASDRPAAGTNCWISSCLSSSGRSPPEDRPLRDARRNMAGAPLVASIRSPFLLGCHRCIFDLTNLC
jgi:hypothetical protein